MIQKKKFQKNEKIIDLLKIGINFGIFFFFLGLNEFRYHNKKYNQSEYVNRKELSETF